MMRKAFAIGVAVILALCITPMIADDTDASVTERAFSNLNEAKIVIQPNYRYYDMVFLEGSPNHEIMQAYIEDPFHAEVPVDDDSDIISSSDVGKTAYIYSTGIPYYYTYTDYTSRYFYPDFVQVLSEAPISFFVKEGDQFSISIIDMETYNSGSSQISISYGMDNERLNVGDDFKMEFGTNHVINIMPTGIAVDLTYEASGYALPNGSSAVFIAAAVIIAVVILGILVMCGMHPRWES